MEVSDRPGENIGGRGARARAGATDHEGGVMHKRAGGEGGGGRAGAHS